MKIIITSIITILVTMSLIDLLWLKIMYSKFYSGHIGHLFTDSPKLIPAIIFYVLFAGALTLFVILPAITNDYSLLKTALLGGAFGLITYGTYDLTNHALMKDWPAIVSVVDILWGTTLSAVVSLSALTISKLFT